MKLSKVVVPFLVVGFIAYNIIKDNVPVEPHDSLESKRSSGITAYGDVGTANDWPNLDDDFDEVSDTISSANYYLVLDGSGSMEDSGCSNGKAKIDVAIESLKSFVSKIPAAANIGVFAFDRQGVGERLPLANHSKQRVHQVFDSIQAGRGTPLSLAVEAGNAALTNQAKKQLGYGEYHLVIVTDGDANKGYEPDYAVRTLLQSSPIVLHTVGFCINENHSLNQPGYTLYKAANDPQSLAAGLDSVLAESPDFNISDFAGEG